MRRLLLLSIAALAAACAPAAGPGPDAEYVPHGRFAPAMPLVQALHECRRDVETAGRQNVPAIGPGPLRQIPAPPIMRPEHASIGACMDAKGYRRAAPAQ